MGAVIRFIDLLVGWLMEFTPPPTGSRAPQQSAGRWRTAARFGAMAVAMHCSGIPIVDRAMGDLHSPITITITYHILLSRVSLTTSWCVVLRGDWNGST